jgi:hypothetical protein
MATCHSRSRRQLRRLLPLPQRKIAVLHGQPDQAVLPLLRLRRPRHGDQLRHGIPGLGFVDAVKDLATRAGMQVPESEGRSFNDEKPGQTRTLIEIMARAAQYYKDQLKKSPRPSTIARNAA